MIECPVTDRPCEMRCSAREACTKMQDAYLRKDTKEFLRSMGEKDRK